MLSTDAVAIMTYRYGLVNNPSPFCNHPDRVAPVGGGLLRATGGAPHWCPFSVYYPAAASENINTPQQYIEREEHGCEGQEP